LRHFALYVVTAAESEKSSIPQLGHTGMDAGDRSSRVFPGFSVVPAYQ
jgi:hypothetical protein